MRTWTLSEKGLDVRVKPENEVSMADERLTRVIELEPVLDLLEAWIAHFELAGLEVIPLTEQTKAFLRAHGRLDG